MEKESVSLHGVIMKKPARIEDWSIIYIPGTETIPENPTPLLQGIVYDHANLPDGEHTITSPITFLDVKMNKAQTKNTLYNLGAPSKEFLKFLKDEGYKLTDYNSGVFDVRKNKL